ncbi:MAG: 16S rRNA (guanine(527)-N(7))-methyltransferase RsmG [Terrimesophilobacter sp.]
MSLEVEPEPALATELFGDQIDAARKFASELTAHGVERGLIGPVELERLWTRHLINSVLVAPLLHPGRVGDVGSGAGLPGLVLAITRPDVEFLLIEPMERRVDWLFEMVSVLGLTNVDVLRCRAEEAHPAPLLDQLTARAVSALSKLIPVSVPLVRSGGELLFLKGARVAEEVEAAAKAIRKARLSNVEVVILGSGQGTETTRLFRATVD